MSWRVALMWGTVIVAVVLGVLAAAYLLIQTLCLVELRGPLMKLTHKFAEMTPEKRPRDPHGTGLRFETMDHGGKYLTRCRKPSN